MRFARVRDRASRQAERGSSRSRSSTGRLPESRRQGPGAVQSARRIGLPGDLGSSTPRSLAHGTIERTETTGRNRRCAVTGLPERGRVFRISGWLALGTLNETITHEIYVGAGRRFTKFADAAPPGGNRTCSGALRQLHSARSLDSAIPQWTAAWSLKETMEASSDTLRTNADGRWSPPWNRLSRRHESAASKRAGHRGTLSCRRAFVCLLFTTILFLWNAIAAQTGPTVRAAPGRDDERRRHLRRQLPRPQQGRHERQAGNSREASARSSPPTRASGRIRSGRRAQPVTGA